MGAIVGKNETLVTFIHAKKTPLSTDLAAYFQRPRIYFYFGLPLLAPSVMLIIVASLNDDVNSGFLAIGSILFTLAMLSFGIGTLLGIRDFRISQKCNRNTPSRDSALVERADGWSPRTSSTTLTLPSTGTPSASSPSSSISLRKSSSNSSLTSLKSGSSSSSSSSHSISVLNSKDKSKLIGLKKTASRRKRGVKFPVDRLPSLQEEDTFIRTSRECTQATLPAQNPPMSSSMNDKPLPPSKANLEELKEYLNAISLGGTTSLRPSTSECRRTRSFEEKDIIREITEHSIEHASHSSREESSVKPSRTPRPLHPVLVSSSHERTGIRLPTAR